jgi:hypothetical protein
VHGDFFAVPSQTERKVTHNPGCEELTCGCFGTTWEVLEQAGHVMALRLHAGEHLVGTAKLVVFEDTLVMTSAAVFRGEDTQDWGEHARVVAEMLVRAAVQVADTRGDAVAVQVTGMEELLTELGFEPAGTLMARPARAAAG